MEIIRKTQTLTLCLDDLDRQRNRTVESKIYDLAFDFLMDYGVDISVVIKNENQFNYWLGALPFYDNVQREGMVLNG